MEEQRLDDLPAHTLDGLLDTASDFQHLITSFHATLGEARERIDQLEVALMHQLFPAFRSQLAQSIRTVKRLEHDHKTARTDWEEERHSLLQELSLVRSELKEARAGSSKDDACEAREKLTDVRQRKLKPDSDPLSRPILVEIDRQVPRGVTRRQGRDVASNYIAQEKENLGRSLKSKEEKPQGLLKDSDQLKLSYKELHRKYKNLQSQYNSLQQLLWGRTSNLLGSSVYEGRSPKTPGTTITVLPQALVTAPEPDNPEVAHDLASEGNRIPTSRSPTRKSGGIATNASVHIEVEVGSRSLKTTDMKENVMPTRNSASSVVRTMADGVQIRMSEAGPQQPALEVVTAIPLSGWTRDKPTILGIPKPEEQNCMMQEPGTNLLLFFQAFHFHT